VEVRVVPIVPREGTALLVIDKVFLDGNYETPITLRMMCDGGSYTPEFVEVIPDGPAGDLEQAFVIFNIPQGGIQECTVTEDPVPGYHTISVCIPEAMSTFGEYTAFATVTTHVIPQWFPAASNTVTGCWAEEFNLASGVETMSECGDSRNPGMELTVGGGDVGCTITNTMFFEGIPTLSQYGMAIMALLMLGMGMLGFRRFS
jgi:hypothetical protein